MLGAVLDDVGGVGLVETLVADLVAVNMVVIATLLVVLVVLEVDEMQVVLVVFGVVVIATITTLTAVVAQVGAGCVGQGEEGGHGASSVARYSPRRCRSASAWPGSTWLRQPANAAARPTAV